MQDVTDCSKLEIINQDKHICSSITPGSSISSLKKRDCIDIELNNEEYTDDETEIAELIFQSQGPDFRSCLLVAPDTFRQKTKRKLILKNPISFELFAHVDTTDLIEKLRTFPREANLDIQTPLEEKLNDSVLKVVLKWIRSSTTRPRKTPYINQSNALLSYCN